MNKFIDKLVGSKAKENLQHRVLVLSMLIASLLGFLTTITNLLFEIQKEAAYLSFFSFLYFVIFYFISRSVTRYIFVIYSVLIGVFLILIPAAWFINQGLAGSTVYFVIIAIVAAYSMTEGKMRRIVLSISSISYISLLIIEYYHPEFLIHYPTRADRFLDVGIFAIVSIITGAFYLNLYYDKYIQANKQLKESNNLLLASQKERQKQQKLIEEQNKELVQKAEDLKKANETKARLYSIIAHDLKSPFNTIIGFSALIAEAAENKNYEDVIQYSRFIENSSEQVYKLLLNLLDWTRLQTQNIEYKPEKIPLQELIEEQIKIFSFQAQNKNISLKSKVEKCLVFADKNMLETIIRNLISNAIKYTENGSVTINAVQKNNHYEISVKDTGIGLDEETIKNIFQFQTTTKGTQGEKGSGLGLQLCKEFIEINKGRLEIESQKGAGSTFIFTVPVWNNN